MASKQYDIHSLRDLLNYDTYTLPFLTEMERYQIHRALSSEMQGFKHQPFPLELQWKLENCRSNMKKDNWQHTEIRVVEENTEIKVNIIK